MIALTKLYAKTLEERDVKVQSCSMGKHRICSITEEIYDYGGLYTAAFRTHRIHSVEVDQNAAQ